MGVFPGFANGLIKPRTGWVADPASDVVIAPASCGFGIS